MDQHAPDSQNPPLEELAAADELESGTNPSEERAELLRPLLISAVAHGIALIALASLSSQVPVQPAPAESAAIQLRIRLPSPQTRPPGVTVPVEQVTDDAMRPPPASSPPGPVVNLPASEPSPVPAPITPEVVPDRPTLKLLTPESLRETIDGIVERQDADSAWIDCTVLQEQSHFIECAEEDSRDFSVLERNETHEFFTRQDAPVTRTQRTIGYMVSRANDIEQQLLASDIGGPAVDRFLRELRSTAVDISRSGNMQVKALRDQMHSNDATYQQKERVLNPR